MPLNVRPAAGPTNPAMAEPTPTPPQNDPPDAESRRVLESDELFAGDNKVFIRHANELYRLLKTKNGKLILQK